MPDPSTNKLVLLTRPYEDSLGLSAKLEKYGIESFIEPFLTIESVPFSLKDQKFDNLVFTSRHAVREFCKSYECQEKPVYTVGSATAQIARDHGFKQVFEAGGDVESLIKLLRDKTLQSQTSQSQTILYIRGRDVSRDLAESLRDRDIQSVIVYKADTKKALSESLKIKLQEGAITDIVLLSSRTAQAFAKTMIENDCTSFAKSINLLCFGEGVLEYLSNFEWKNTYISPKKEIGWIIKELAGEH